MVECYCGLYEEGEVEYINCPHPPTRRGIIGGANQRPTNMEVLYRQIAMWLVSGSAVICLKLIKLALNLAVEL